MSGNGAAAAAANSANAVSGCEIPDGASIVSIDGVDYVKQKEGEAEILQMGNQVFYNKAQVRGEHMCRQRPSISCHSFTTSSVSATFFF